MKSLVLILLGLLLFSCQSKTKKAGPGEIVIMTYNVENLFDTKRDIGKEDHEYQPKSQKSDPNHVSFCQSLEVERYRKSCMGRDWTKKLLKRKMRRLADVILGVNGGRGPDVLLLQEVENFDVLNELRTNYLKKAQYRDPVLIEGADPRGIDTALLTRLPVSGTPKLHQVEFVFAEGMTAEDKFHIDRGTRGILETTLELPDGNLLTTLVVHFPSQGAPTAFRKQAIAKLNAIKQQLPKGRMVIAGGDFNIARKEDVTHGLYRDLLAPQWLVSHQIGCRDCKGTNYYHRELSWSFLDALLFDKRMENNVGEAPWHVDHRSIYIHKKSIYQVNKFGSPARFGGGYALDGVSDHWPIVAVIRKVVLPDGAIGE